MYGFPGSDMPQVPAKGSIVAVVQKKGLDSYGVCWSTHVLVMSEPTGYFARVFEFIGQPLADIEATRPA